MPCICLLRLTFLEDIFCHELHCLPKPVRSVGVFYLLFWHASWFYECCILNEISVNPFHCSQGWRFLKRSLEIVISLCCCFRSIHTQAWKKGPWKLVIIWWWSGHPSVAWSTSRAGGYVTSCSIYMKQQWDKCRGSLWQTQSWHCICKLLEHGYKKGHNKVCEHLAIYFEGAECPGCALLFPRCCSEQYLWLRWALNWRKTLVQLWCQDQYVLCSFGRITGSRVNPGWKISPCKYDHTACAQQPELILSAVVAAHPVSRCLAHPHDAFRSVLQHRLFEMTHTLRLNL